MVASPPFGKSRAPSPLERWHAAPIDFVMPVSRRTLALAAGITASAASLGILLGLGRTSSDPLFAMAAGGHLWLGASARLNWPYVLVGTVRHVVLVSLLGFAVTATPRTRAHLCWVSAVVAAVAVVVGPFLPDVIRPIAVDLAPVEQVALWLALTVGLAAGARLAPEGMP